MAREVWRRVPVARMEWVDHVNNHVPFIHVAEELGISKGRVSQLHHAALAPLRRGLNLDAIEEDASPASGTSKY